MSEWKSFNGKTVDAAIEEACRKIGVDREKLEVEIIKGGSSGIFGLVAKKKAEIKARLRPSAFPGAKPEQEQDAEPAKPALDPQPQTGEPRPAKAKSRSRRNRREAENGKKKSETSAAQPETRESETAENSKDTRPSKTRMNNGKAQKTEKTKQTAPADLDAATFSASFNDNDSAAFAVVSLESSEEHSEISSQGGNGFADFPDEIEQGEPEILILRPGSEAAIKLQTLVEGTLSQILKSILGVVPELETFFEDNRLQVQIHGDEHAGLLIGRDGQTLDALQYFLNRIVARHMPGIAQIQINAGAYRQRQDEYLRKIALILADKAKTQGRPQNTRPLSSYHRRVIHMALQEDPGVQTRSKGDGPLKRVLILPRRKERVRRH